ncbi:MAG: hypothetical protein L6Q54_12735 [Leptospiraceae bacterium]|nr:hypothetical protein [Leptospiraceae bacterium]MCK6382100.1 hypothetical protein [Leptospiraceae bacterium]
MKIQNSSTAKGIVVFLVLLFPYCMVDARLNRIQEFPDVKTRKAYLLLQSQNLKQSCVLQAIEIQLIQDFGITQGKKNYSISIYPEYFSLPFIQKFYRFTTLPPPTTSLS